MCHSFTHVVVCSPQAGKEIGHILWYCGGVRKGTAIHFVNGHAYLPAEHQEKGRVSCCLVDACFVGEAQSSEVVLPFKWLLPHCFGQHVQQYPVEPFHKAIRLWMIWGGS